MNTPDFCSAGEKAKNIASERLQDLTGLDLKYSRFSAYTPYTDLSANPFAEDCGFFVPRNLHGFVREDSNQNETLRRYVHEVSHGLYLENFQRGQMIVCQDKKVSEAEAELFGRLIKKREMILVFTQMGRPEMFRMADLDKELRTSLENRGTNVCGFEYVAFLPEDGLSDYSRLRESYMQLVESDIEDQEGFCVLMETMCSDAKTADAIKGGLWEATDVYGRGFRKLKKIETAHGLKGVLRHLDGNI